MEFQGQPAKWKLGTKQTLLCMLRVLKWIHILNIISISERGETPPTQTKIRDTYKCVHGPQLGADPLFGKQCTNAVIYRERHRELQAEADHLIQLAQLSSACVRGEKWLDSV